MTFIPHVIDGQEAESVSGARFASVDPWTREPHAEVALGGPEHADRAVAAARRAFDEGPWPRMGFAERGALLHRFADLIEANADALALAVHRRGAADGQRPTRLHAVGAGRRGRRDRAVELPAHARVLEGNR